MEDDLIPGWVNEDEPTQVLRRPQPAQPAAPASPVAPPGTGVFEPEPTRPLGAPVPPGRTPMPAPERSSQPAATGAPPVGDRLRQDGAAALDGMRSWIRHGDNPIIIGAIIVGLLLLIAVATF